MGYGLEFDETNPKPWLDRVALHTGTKVAALRAPDRACLGAREGDKKGGIRRGWVHEC